MEPTIPDSVDSKNFTVYQPYLNTPVALVQIPHDKSAPSFLYPHVYVDPPTQHLNTFLFGSIWSVGMSRVNSDSFLHLEITRYPSDDKASLGFVSHRTQLRVPEVPRWSGFSSFDEETGRFLFIETLSRAHILDGDDHPPPKLSVVDLL